MTLDQLLSSKSQLRLATAVDHLLSSNSLAKHARTYLITCKQEGKSRRTIDVYSMVLQRFLENVDSIDVCGGDVRLFLLSLQQSTFKPGTVHIYYRSLKTFFNWLVAEGYYEKSPMQNVKPPKLPRPVIMPFSLQDIQNLLKLTAGSKFLDLRNRAIFLLFLDTGVRAQEMADIQLGDIDFDYETIRIMGKGSKGRFVRIGKTTQKALLKYWLAREDIDFPQLWLSEERRPMKRDGIQQMVRHYCRAAVKSGARPSCHTFRHTAAIFFLRNGGDIFSLQIMLGHSALEMTRRYVSTLGVEDMIRAHQKASPVDRMRLW
jgi:site-specific recombinase XerD